MRDIGLFRHITKIITLVLVLALMQSAAYAEDTVYKEGDKGQQIASIQLRLNKLGYTKRVITGVYDKQTVKAVKNFQKKNKLATTGLVDGKTYEALFNEPNLEKKPPEVVNSTVNGNAITSTAEKYLGVPYRYGGASPAGFDCSGLVMYVFEKNNKKLPRTADIQFKTGTKIDRNKLKEGDLVFFTTDEPGPSHVGIYYGNNKFIHASSSKGVMVSSLNDVYWKPRYLGARRA